MGSPEERALAEIYNQYRCSQSARNVLEEQHGGAEKASAPFLIKPPSDYLECNKTRIMYIGQETKGWGEEDCQFDGFVDRDDAVQRLMTDYEKFDFSENKNNWANKRGPFWQFHRRLCRALNINYRAMVWANLMHCDVNAGSAIGTRLEPLITQFQNGLLLKEIEILKPDIILFVTGPYYDGQLSKSLGNFETVQIIETLKTRQYAKLNFGTRITNMAFRTYHPAYLNRNKVLQDTVFSSLVEHISSAKSNAPR